MLDVFLTSSIILNLGSPAISDPVEHQMPLERFAYDLTLCETGTAESVESFSAGWAQEEAWD